MNKQSYFKIEQCMLTHYRESKFNQAVPKICFNIPRLSGESKNVNTNVNNDMTNNNIFIHSQARQTTIFKDYEWSDYCFVW